MVSGPKLAANKLNNKKLLCWTEKKFIIVLLSWDAYGSVAGYGVLCS